MILLKTDVVQASSVIYENKKNGDAFDKKQLKLCASTRNFISFMIDPMIISNLINSVISAVNVCNLFHNLSSIKSNCSKTNHVMCILL